MQHSVLVIALLASCATTKSDPDALTFWDSMKSASDAPIDSSIDAMAIDAMVDGPLIDASADAPWPDGPQTPDAAVDAAVDASLPDATMGVCDPVLQTGCATGYKCTAILVSDSPVTLTTMCAPNGSDNQWASCTRQPPGLPPTAGNDSCAAGAMCLFDGGANGLCQPICDIANPSCPSGPHGDYPCIAQQGIFDDVPGNVGFCEVSCDPANQTTCTTGGESCYQASAGYALCAATGTLGLNADCQFINGCQERLHCIMPNAGFTSLACGAYCDLSGGQSAGDSQCNSNPDLASYLQPRCQQLRDIFTTPDPNLGPDVGTCVDCSIYPTGSGPSVCQPVPSPTPNEQIQSTPRHTTY